MKNDFKTCLILAMLLLSLQSMVAQNQFFPLFNDKPTWNELTIRNSFSGGSSLSTRVFSYQEEKKFCGHTYSMTTINNEKIGVRNEGTKTYFRLSEKCTDKEYLLYDFGMKVGEKQYFAYTAFNTLDSSLFTLKKIDSVNYLDKKSRRFLYDFEYYKSSIGDNTITKEMEIIEGVGSTRHPFFAVEGLARSLVDGPSFLLLCAFNNQKQIYQTPNYKNCIYETVGNDDMEETNDFVVFPNPSTEKIVVTLSPTAEKSTLEVCNLNGQKIFSAAFSDTLEIETSSWQSGYYVVYIKNNTVNRHVKILKL